MKGKRDPKKLKWTSISNDDAASKPMENCWVKERLVANGPVTGEKENDLRQIRKIPQVTETVT